MKAEQPSAGSRVCEINRIGSGIDVRRSILRQAEKFLYWREPAVFFEEDSVPAFFACGVVWCETWRSRVWQATN